MRTELLTPPTSPFQPHVVEPVDFYFDSRNNAIEWHMCTIGEVQEAVFYAGNISPGIDKIPPFIIKKAWPLYKEEITLLFQLCLPEGYYPLVFKTAVLCAPPKPGKRPKHLPRSYCLIALLSCLGKVLERIVARRLGDIALKFRLVSPLHFGAIPGRSAVDAAATLTHDVERAWEEKMC